MKNKKLTNMLEIAVLLLGVVMVVEAGATLFVMFSIPQASGLAALAYVIVKGFVGIFAISAGHFGMKNKFVKS